MPVSKQKYIQKKTWWLFGFILAFSHIGFAQNEAHHSFIDIKCNGTYVLPHHKKMQHLIDKHFIYSEISFVKKTQGKSYWQHLYNYPYWGLSLHYNNFGGNDILGNAFALYPFINLPLYKKPKSMIGFRLGSGLAYITNPYDRILNHKNVAISTAVNLCISFSFEFEQHLSNQFILYQNVSIIHFSNGGLRMPNTGINLPSLGVGIRYKLPKETAPVVLSEIPTFEKKHFASITIAGGLNEIYPTYGKKHPAFSLSTGYNYQPSLKRILNLNFDLSYNTSNFQSLDNKNISYKKAEILRPGISIGQEFLFGKTSFVFHTGWYLYAKEDRDGNIYNRVGYRRSINRHLFLNLTLKSHLFRADFIEWGFGYRF